MAGKVLAAKVGPKGRLQDQEGARGSRSRDADGRDTAVGAVGEGDVGAERCHPKLPGTQKVAQTPELQDDVPNDGHGQHRARDV